MPNDVKVHIAFRFHTNFYHSYRGDTPDEHGFGKDIRIIRMILDVLDKWNAQGLPVKGTWDIENLFSLGDIIPKHAPDIIERIKGRQSSSGDEVEIMSYNNGLINAHTGAEFDAAIGRAIYNTQGSGNADIFDNVVPVVRPQEMMFTPMHIKLYHDLGIEAVSLYYSGIPFNTFSNFIPPLSFTERYNPLTLIYPGIEESLVVLPAYNHGDIGDHLSLRRWVKQLRKQQLAQKSPHDVLLILDADADDEYWAGYPWPVVKMVFAAARGLDALIASIADLDFVSFTTPYTYLQSHSPVGSISFGQDTADGSFDGFASWAEKWSNHQLWTGINRSRILEQHVRRLIEITGHQSAEVTEHLEQAFELRLRALSTTHFGLSAPVMNRPRLHQAADMIAQAVAHTQSARDILVQLISVPVDALVLIPASIEPGHALVKLPFDETSDAPTVLQDNHGLTIPATVLPGWQNERHHVVFVTQSQPQGTMFKPDFDDVHPPAHPVKLISNSISNRWLAVNFSSDMQPTSLTYNGREITVTQGLNSSIRYQGRNYRVEKWAISGSHHLAEGCIVALRVRGEVVLHENNTPFIVEREYLLHADLPYLYLTTHVQYPETEHKKYDEAWAKNLGQTYDSNWQEVRPCEFALNPLSPGKVMRIWKHNYLNHVSNFDLDMGRYSRNNTIDSMNNAITNGWVAITDGQHGLLLAQDARYTTNFAFCPMRIREKHGCQQVSLNPFGSYSGRQWHYPTADTGLGKLIGTTISETLRPFAPSYNGKSETFSLLIAPYEGDQPSTELQRDAMTFTQPPIVLAGSESGFAPKPLSWKLDNG